HFPSQWLRRIQGRASAMENLECERFRIERRRRNSLRPTICRNPKSATALHIHRRRLADYGPRPPDTVGRLCQTPAEANGISHRRLASITSRATGEARRVKFRRAGSNRFQWAYQSVTSL